MVEGYAQMFEERYLTAGLVVEGYGLVEDGEVARFLDVCHRTEDKPAGVIVETTADVVVATLGEGLVLVVAATVGELRRGNIDDALTGTAWYLVYEAHKVLV